MAKNRNQKRTAKLKKRAKKKAAKRGWEFEAHATKDGTFLNVLIRQPDGGEMPTRNYQGQDALDRVRRWAISRSEGVNARKAVAAGKPSPRRSSDVDPGWFGAPAFGNPEGVHWIQESTPTGAIIKMCMPFLPGMWTGIAESDKEAMTRGFNLMHSLWQMVDILTPEEVAYRLLDTESAGPTGNQHIIVNGWSFLYSHGPEMEDCRLCILSAELRPRGRGSEGEDWQYLGSVMAALGAPHLGNAGAFVEFTDVRSEDLDCNGRLKWMWRTGETA